MSRSTPSIITIYGPDQMLCSNTENAKRLLNKLKIPYTFIAINTQGEKQRMYKTIKKWPRSPYLKEKEHRTVPIIKSPLGILIGGFSDLQTLFLRRRN